MKLKIRKFFIKLWEKINFGNNKKKITIWFFVSIIIITILTILLVSVFTPKHNIYKGQTVASIKDHLKDDGLKCEENKAENMYTCKRGPVVFKTNSKMIFTDNSKDKKILEDLVEWFYLSVPWGAEILHLREIFISDDQMPGDNGPLKETWYMGKRWGGSFLSLQLYVAPFLKGLENETKAYFEKTKESNSLLVDTNPLEKAIDQIQYYLYREYVQMKFNLYYEDFSTSYREGGWSDRAVLKKINLRSEAIYQQRFNDSQKTNLRYPFNPNDLNHFNDQSTKEYTLKQIYDMSNDLLGATSNWSFNKPLIHLNEVEWENNGIQLIQEANKQAYFNGLDRGYHLDELELSVWEAENLLDDYRTTFLDPILEDLNLQKFSSDGSIAETSLVTLREFIKNEDLKQFHANRQHLSSYQFAGYHYQWTQIFFEKVVLPVWNVNKKVKYSLSNQKFIDVLKQYKKDKDENKLTNSNLISPDFNISDELKDKNDNYISHPDYPIELGSLKMSQFNFYNQAYFMIARDYQLLSMGFEPLSRDKSVNQNRMATNIDNPFWLDVSLLQAFNALPYDDMGVLTDTNLVKILAKILRIDQDIAMSYKSQISGFSYLWGYMPENTDYKALVFKSDSVTKKIPIYQAKYNNSDSNEKSMDFDHTFYLTNFMNRTAKESMTKIMQRKAWITDWNLIDDFENAVVPTGEYTVSFEDKKGNLIPIKEYDFPGSSTLFQWKLNPWGDYDIFSGFQFYYDIVSKVVKLKVNSRSWVD